jgi:hypothetical protein
MAETFAFPQCPFRDATHRVVDRSSLARAVARAVWPSARRAERVELTDDGIEAWTLVGRTRLGWEELTAVGEARGLLRRRTLRAEGPGGRIEIAPILPGYATIEARLRSACS